MPFCRQCGKEITQDAGFCPHCGTEQISYVTTPPSEARKRPRGLTIIAILWFIGGIYNLYISSQTISADLEALSYLSRLPTWFRFGVPAELAINLLAFALGLIQMFTIYGLWTGKPWSYRLALAVPILAFVSVILEALLYLSAPIQYGLIDDINWAVVGGSIIGMGIYLSYLRQPHVKEYLGVLPPTMKAVSYPSTLPPQPPTPPPPTAPNKCPFCGFEIQLGDVFCTNCGKKIAGEG